jgi:FkbM family methyltransferase
MANRVYSWVKVVVRPPLRLASALPGFKSLLRQVSMRTRRARWVFQSFPVEGCIRVTTPDGGSLTYASTNRDFIGRELYWYGWDGFEPETTGVFFALARRSRRVVDVGANTGFYTLIAGIANSACHILAIEPVPRVCDLLRSNVALNELGDRCEIVAAAVSSASGSVAFHVPHEGVPTSASLHADGFRGYEGALTEVPCRTLDELCAGGDPVDLVKIDVEGFEDVALEGAREVLKRSQPALVIECNVDGPYPRVQEILTPHGYTFFHLTDEGPRRVAQIQPDETERFRNYICLPGNAAERWGLEVEGGLLRMGAGG